MTEADVQIKFDEHLRFINLASCLISMGCIKEAHSIIEQLAIRSSNNYAGFYSDGSMEKLLIQLAKYCKSDDFNVVRKCDSLPLSIHIVTSTYKVGGHCRLLREWVTRYNEHEHVIIITEENNVDREFFNGTSIIELGYLNNPFEKAGLIRSIAKQADYVFLHHHMHDITSVMALATQDLVPPVAILNHADHLFWAGVSVCDYIIEIREGYLPLDIERRQVDCGGYLPIPVKPDNQFEKTDCRAELGISSETIVLLTMASAFKFSPTENYDFFNSILPVLQKNKEALLIVIGIDKDNPLARIHPQVRYEGIVVDPAKYKVACDIYVESFPFSSFTSLLETVVNGAALHLMYNPPLLSKMLTFDYHNEKSIWNYATNISEWQLKLNILISNDDVRVASMKVAKEYVSKAHYNDWLNYLNDIYNHLSRIKHKVHKTKPTQFFMSENEFFLIEFQRKVYPKSLPINIFPIPWSIRLKVLLKWIFQFCRIKIDDLSFIYFFLIGKYNRLAKQ
jgi:hypothetical protein